MKIFMYNKFIALLMLTLFATACEKDVITSDSLLPLSLTAIVEDQTKATADKTAFEVNDEVYLWVTHTQQAITASLKHEINYIDMAKFKVGANAALNGSAISFPHSDSRFGIYALSPAAAHSPLEQSDANVLMSFTVKTDQNTPENYKASDLLTSNKTDVVSTSPSAALLFKHRMAKIRIEVVAPDKYKGIAFSNHGNFKVNSNITGKVVLNNNTVTPTTSPGVITAHRVSELTTTKSVIYEMLIVPQTIPARTLLFNTVANFGSTVVDFKYTTSAEMIFRGGKQHNFIVGLADMEIYNIDTPTIEDWGVPLELPADVTFAKVLNTFTLPTTNTNARNVDSVRIELKEFNAAGNVVSNTYTVTATLDSGNYKFEFDDNDNQPVKYPFTIIKIEALNTSNAEIESLHCAQTELTAAERNTHVQLTPIDSVDYTNTPANCYIINAGKRIKFNAKLIGITPSTKINAFSPNLGSAPGYGTPENVGSNTNITIATQSVAVKWQTAHGHKRSAPKSQMLIANGSIEYDASTGICSFPITNPSGSGQQGGSAYVCAYSGPDGTGTILWSWHIWVLPATEKVAKLDNNLQDRNLGAITKTAGANSFGMIYQWGRKDPFTGASTFSNNATLGNEVAIYNAAGVKLVQSANNKMTGEWKHDPNKITTINDLIKDPSTYFTKGNVPIANVPGDNDWWSPKVKTMYDPCPVGYMVSQKDKYNGIGWSYIFGGNNINNGANWETGFFPAAGYRNIANGSFEAVTSLGLSWTSTLVEKNSYPNIITQGNNIVNINYGASRALGFTVRCVAEL